MANETQHTAGPWSFMADDGSIFAADGDVEPRIATIEYDNTSDAQYLADGRLIAAAPALFERVAEDTKAFEQLHAYLTKHAEKLPPFSLSTLEVLIAKNRAAIAKATTPT